MSYELLILLLVFQIKHFICDYPLQNTYMLGKMKSTGWIKPLAAHSAVHAWFTFLIILLVQPSNVLLYLLIPAADFILHFTVDRIKASPNLGGKFKPEQPYFWWALGADQMAHHIINYVFIYIILNY